VEKVNSQKFGIAPAQRLWTPPAETGCLGLVS
jgi:hypothetical protein